MKLVLVHSQRRLWHRSSSQVEILWSKECKIPRRTDLPSDRNFDGTGEIMEKSSEPPRSSEPLDNIKNELDLKKAELTLKEKELAEKTESERRNIWFTSPLIVTALSAIFGLLGTGIGAVLQGYWNTQLERQKFESVLIQKALEQKDREEVAKNLLFLVKIGLIQSLNCTLD